MAKAAAGAIEHLPMTVVGGLPAAISKLQDLGVVVVGLDMGGPTSLFDLPITATQALGAAIALVAIYLGSR